MLSKPEIVEHPAAVELVETLPVETCGGGEKRVLVFTIHDGDQFPGSLFGNRAEGLMARPEVQAAFVKERDWGADLVAKQLAREIGAANFLRVKLARAMMDFGRFPGVSKADEPYLRRRSIFPPLGELLNEETKHTLLKNYYDVISQSMVQHFADRNLTLAVHTYDRYNSTGTERPEVSLVSRSLAYQETSTIPPKAFDPLFPPILCEATCYRPLTYQTLVNLEMGGFHTALNYPYVMPEGSVEIRAQVWFFFRYLRQQFTAAFPETRDQACFHRVWQMLLDVTHRSDECEHLRGFLRHYRGAPRGSEKLFAETRIAYGEIAQFLHASGRDFIDEYRYSHTRPSCLGIEVRKDLLWELDEMQNPVSLKPDAAETANKIAHQIAMAVRGYLQELDGLAQPDPAIRYGNITPAVADKTC